MPSLSPTLARSSEPTGASATTPLHFLRRGGPATGVSRPAAAPDPTESVATALRAVPPYSGGGCSGLLAAGRPTASAQIHAGLAEDAVDETVRATGGGGQSPNALAGVVPLLELR